MLSAALIKTKRTAILSIIYASAILLACAALLHGQTTATVAPVVATGISPYGTFDNLGFDTINVGNLDVYFALPVLNKTGRGLPLTYNLSYDSSVWSVGQSASSKTAWTPVQNWGWRGQSEMTTGYLSGSYIEQQCYTTVPDGPNGPQQVVTGVIVQASGFAYHDQWGIAHAFPGEFNTVTGTCGANVLVNTLSNSVATDGSGYEYLGGPNGGNVIDRNGKMYAPPFNTTAGAATVTDNNGNEITVNNSGQFIDTTGNVALTVAQSSPTTQTFTYSDTNGKPQSVTVFYSPQTVQTNFGCSGIAEFGPAIQYLVSSIVFADGSSYKYTYEETPGVAGAVTGRLASVTLPQNGLISYAYTGSNNGIECADGSTAGLTRTMTGSAGSAASTWTYSRATGFQVSQTNVVDGLNNQKIYNFGEAGNQPSGTTAQYYETQRAIYQGAANGTPVLLRQTAYDGGVATTVNPSITLPITEIDTYQTLNGLQTDGSTAYYDAYGNLLTLNSYDFGAGTTRGALLQAQSWKYNLNSEPTTYQVTDGAGNTVTLTNYGYDESALTDSSGVPQHTSPTCAACTRGNLTSAHLYASANNSLTTTIAYEDTGSILSVTSPSGTETFTYDPAFVHATGVQYPALPSGVALSAGFTYDTTYTGLPVKSTDMNTNLTKITSYDTLLRPTQISYPDGGETAATYTPTLITANTYQSSSVYSTTETQFDSYGRPSRSLVANGQSSNSWYQADSCYDANGNQSFASYQYQGAGLTAAKVCSGAGDTYAYDVLGRLKLLTRANGEKITYTYLGRATKVVDQNGVTRISQVDGLGRPTIVCEISSNSSMPGSGTPVSCGTDIAGTGFTTNYSYSLANHTTTIAQGVQTRIFQTDWLGRATSVTEPESGTATYSYAYNSTGLVVTRTRPTANQLSSSVLTTTTTQYDSLNRPISITYSDGTPAKTFTYDKSIGWSDLSQVNIKGQLSEASVANAATVYSYDATGRVKSLDECLPSGCADSVHHPLHYTYDLAGNLLSSTDGAVTSSYTVSLASEALSLTSSLSNSTNPATILSNVLNGPNGPLNFKLGNGLTGVYSYDALGRLNGGYVCNGSSSAGCSGGTQLYEFSTAWKGSQIQSSTDSALGQSSTYGYDEFNRLTSRAVTAGTAANYSWTYDRYGNRTAQTPLNGGLTFQTSVNTATNQLDGYTYDAAGNMTNDGSHSYTYDAEGNITAVDGGATAQYVYNALNQRVRTVVGSTATEFVFDKNGRRASVWNGTTGAQLRGQYYWGGQPVAFYLAGGAAQFQHQDWLGTERLRTTYNGAVAGTYTSLPFGDAQTPTGADNDPYHFAALDSDAETSTDHAQFRQYSATEGRWMRPDPYAGSYDPGNPQSFNRYSYVLNNPLGGTDPLGLDDEDPDSGDGVYDPDCGLACDGSGGAAGGDGGGDGYYSGVAGPDDDQPLGFIFYLDNPKPYYTDVYDFLSAYGGIIYTGQSFLSSGLVGGGYAPNNGPQPQNPIMSKVQKFVCKGSAADRVFASVKQGAIVGGVRGAASGFIGGEIAEPLGGGIPGALLGGFLGGTLGAAGGVFTGSAIAFGCSVAGAYGAGG